MTESVWENLSWHRRVLRSRIFQAISVVFMTVCAIFAPNAILYVAAFVIAIVLAAWLDRTTKTKRRELPPAPLPPQVAWLAAHRHCGACGYGLKALEPDANGLTLCPECGASWHRDRWTLQARDPKPDRDQRRTERTAVDDRGVPLVVAPTFPPAWFSWPTTPRDAKARITSLVVDERRKESSLRLQLAAPALVCMWALIALAVLAFFRSLGEPWTFALLRGSVAATITIASVVGLITDTTTAIERLRAPVLAERLCLGCGRPLPIPDPAAPAQFDGCTICFNCGRAWKEPPTTIVASAP